MTRPRAPRRPPTPAREADLAEIHAELDRRLEGFRRSLALRAQQEAEAAEAAGVAVDPPWRETTAPPGS